MEKPSHPPPVSDAELAVRRERMTAIDHALAQEGLVPSPEGRAIGDRYAAGEVSIQDAIAQLTKLHQQPAPRISAAARAARQASVDFARGSVRFEGHVLDAEVEQLNARFISGEITQEQYTQAVLRSAGLPPA